MFHRKEMPRNVVFKQQQLQQRSRFCNSYAFLITALWNKSWSKQKDRIVFSQAAFLPALVNVPLQVKPLTDYCF